jgi:hypothetical protein
LEKIKTPENVVPAEYQFDFIVSQNKPNYEYACYTVIYDEDEKPYGNVSFMTSCILRNGDIFVGEKGSRTLRSASVEDANEFANFLNGIDNIEEKIAVLPSGKVIVDNGHIANTEHHALNKFEDELHHFHLQAMVMSLLIAGFGIFLSFVVYQ